MSAKDVYKRQQWTYANIDYMKGQLKRLGFAIDWDRELSLIHI